MHLLPNDRFEIRENIQKTLFLLRTNLSILFFHKKTLKDKNGHIAIRNRHRLRIAALDAYTLGNGIRNLVSNFTLILSVSFCKFLFLKVFIKIKIGFQKT